MSFTIDPSDGDRFYGSGHPPQGSNLGFVTSSDRGQTWDVISMPGVDFHAIAISPSDPDILYGWAVSGQQGLFVSTDRGQSWTQLDATGLEAPLGLTVDPRHSDHILATTQAGLMESKDGGQTWNLSSQTPSLVAGLALTKADEQVTLYGYHLAAKAKGLHRSTDSGQTWQAVDAGLDGTILYLAIAPSNPQVMYAASDNNQIFQSTDGGQSWEKLN
jgi:photosystem II stability/assembly factor-like uncharacterized protein